MTLRLILFSVVLTGGTTILHDLELLPRDEAFLISGVIGALLLLIIPDEGKRRDLGLASFMLFYILMVYGINFKFRAWLATRIDPGLAMASTILLAILVMLSVFMVQHRRKRNQTPSP